MSARDRHFSVFFAAPMGPERKTLEHAFDRSGHKVIRLEGSSLTLQSELIRSIRAADLVVGIITGQPSDSNVFFELGIAVGIGKHIALVLTEPKATIPIDLSDVLSFRYSPQDRSWPDSVTQVMADVASRGSKNWSQDAIAPPQQKGGRGLGKRADALLARLEQSISPHDVEDVVAEMLANAGVDVMARSPRPDMGADFALWIDELHALTGNPILLEVKDLRRGELQKHAVAQMSSYMEKSGSRFALVVGIASGAYEPQLIGTSSGLIISVDIRDLLGQLRRRSLADVIRGMRNRSAHFGGEHG